MTPRTAFLYNDVAIGGTFDSFHKGHELLVSKAFELGRTVIIGITSDSFVKNQKKSHPIQSYGVRVRTLQKFLKSKGWSSRARLARLNNPYGPAATEKDLEALVITPDTADSAVQLNQLRTSKGLRPVTVHTVPMFIAEDGRPISSTRIRRREIDREGRLVNK